MSAQPVPEPPTLEEAAEVIFNEQLAIKSLCAARDDLTREIAARYRAIEDAGYPLRLHLSELKTDSARVGVFDVAVKYDDKKLRIARVLIGATGEARILPRCNTTRIVVRKAKP